MKNLLTNIKRYGVYSLYLFIISTSLIIILAIGQLALDLMTEKSTFSFIAGLIILIYNIGFIVFVIGVVIYNFIKKINKN